MLLSRTLNYSAIIQGVINTHQENIQEKSAHVTLEREVKTEMKKKQKKEERIFDLELILMQRQIKRHAQQIKWNKLNLSSTKKLKLNISTFE